MLLSSTNSIFSILFIAGRLPPPPQIPPPAAPEPPVSDTADLLGLNSDSQTRSTVSSSAAHQGIQGGMKAATSNSNLLDDLFAPPAGKASPVQEDLFFSEPTNEATVNSTCMS